MTSKRAPVQAVVRKDRLAGKTIAERYVIEGLIARGGMAAVYKAHQVKLNRRVAIKILRPPPDSDAGASFHERFRLEAETLAQLNHSNIVTVYDHGDFDDDQVFLAMEFVDGDRLTDLLREGPLPVDRTLYLLMQVCEALRYAHRRGVVHRDLKPSNLLITRTDRNDERVKVVDFGLVKLTEVDTTITSNGLILGSPHCMAPEQVRGQDVDGRTDIYAMGVLLFRCLTGSYPFHGPNSTATMIAHLNQPTPTFFSVAPDFEAPEGLENVARRCLAKNPRERFESMEDLQDALSYFMNVTPEHYRTVTRSHATLDRRLTEVRGRKPWAWAIAGGVGVMSLLGILCAGVVAGSFLAPERPAPVAAPLTAVPPPPVPVTIDRDGNGMGSEPVDPDVNAEADLGVAGEDAPPITAPTKRPTAVKSPASNTPSAGASAAPGKKVGGTAVAGTPVAGTDAPSAGTDPATEGPPAGEGPKETGTDVRLGEDIVTDMDNW
ncbi:MAG: protein kinase [Myxococcota bacterium]